MEKSTEAKSTIVQVRVDNKLKDQVNEIFNKIGLDIPTAVRMFFKAVIREQRIPIKTGFEQRLSRTRYFQEKRENGSRN